MACQMEEIVTRLAISTGREVGSVGHAAAHDYLCEQMPARSLVAYGETGFRLPYSHRGTDFCNRQSKCGLKR